MSTLRQRYDIRAPFLGLFSGNNPGNPKYFSRCYNILFDKAGNPNKRPGFTLSDQTPAAIGATQIDGMFLYVKQGTSGSPTSKTMFHVGGSIFAVPNGSYLQQATAIKTGMTTLKTVDHAVLSDKYYCANGAQVLQTYDGSTIADITTPPASGLTGSFTPSVIEVHRWALWAAGVPGNPCRLFKSVPQDGTDFDTNLAAFNVTDGYALAGASQIDVRPDDGTVITELVGDHFGQLIVFKENSIHRLLGATKADFMLPPEGVIDGIGAIKGSVVRANNDIFFASKKGIHRLSTVQQYGDNRETFISYPVQEYYEGLDKFSMVSWCQSVHWPERNIIIWSFPIAGSGENNVLLIYNYAVGDTGAWSIWTGVNVSSMGIFRFDGANTLFASNYDGQVVRCNPWMLNDINTSYETEVELTFDAGNLSSWKSWRDFIVQFNPSGGTVEIKTKVDEEDWGEKYTIIPRPRGAVLGDFILGTDLLVDVSQIDNQRVEVNKSGKILRINIKNTTMNEKMALLGLTIEWMPRSAAGVHLQSIPNVVVDNLYIEGGLYFGEDDTDGTWRFERNDGVDVDRYEDRYETVYTNYLFVTDPTNGNVYIYTLLGVLYATLNIFSDPGNHYLSGIDIYSENIFITDGISSVGNLIQKYSILGVLISSWGSYGTGDGQLDGPLAITVDSLGNFYVADTNNHRIQKFDANGNFLLKWGSYGTGDGQFRYPYGIDIDSSGNVYVVDTNNYRVQKFDSDGNFILKFGSYGFGDGNFNWPLDLVVDLNNQIVVTDQLLDKVQRFDSSGSFISKFGSTGSGDGEFEEPKGITVGDDNHLYIADAVNERIQRFNASGVYVNQWAVNAPPNRVSIGQIESSVFVGWVEEAHHG